MPIQKSRNTTLVKPLTFGMEHEESKMSSKIEFCCETTEPDLQNEWFSKLLGYFCCKTTPDPYNQDLY